MASGINIYSFFQISEIIIPDICKNYFEHPKTGTYFRYSKSYFGYQKEQFRISKNKHLF